LNRDFATRLNNPILDYEVHARGWFMALEHDDERAIAELWRLLKAFEQITDLKTRREVIEQVEELIAAAGDERGTEH
jgi:hypothetical protein